MARPTLALVRLVCSFHGDGSLWFGEAGILFPIRSIVKPLIACFAFCWVGQAPCSQSSLTIFRASGPSRGGCAGPILRMGTPLAGSGPESRRGQDDPEQGPPVLGEAPGVGGMDLRPGLMR